MLTFHNDHAHIRCGPDHMALDTAGEHAFVSHAHLDHYRSLKKAKTVLSSPETLQLLEARGKAAPKTSLQRHDAHGTRFELLNAGHVLGSRMLYSENTSESDPIHHANNNSHDGAKNYSVHGAQSILYTGDFLSQDSLTQKAARPKDCDILLMECTYGLPQYQFEDRAVVYDQIGKWASAELAAGRIAVIGAYSLGKAQEVIAALNQVKIAPAVSPAIAAVNEVYHRYGVPLDYTLNDAATLGSGAFAAVVPMHQVKPDLAQTLKTAYRRPVKLSVATGWALTGGYGSGGGGINAGFALSDHNDFLGLIEFAVQCNPKKVYTTHGPSDVFAHHLRKAGLDAQPLEVLGEKQKTLAKLI
ncbi:hypothetical protein HY994_06770 [Candidatus Micrarchaeota archaeon]|nr:hypothetical protein [Candidatus Micrarchaeota archaeon]